MTFSTSTISQRDENRTDNPGRDVDLRDRTSEKTEITKERVETILNNMDTPAEELRESTDGLTLPVIRLIKDVAREGLRGKWHERA